MSITLYGIPNCDTVRKARRWLDGESLSYRFHNFKTDPPDSQRIAGWIDSLGLERVVNKRSATYRQLSEAQKQDLAEASTPAFAIIAAHPSVIKRPVLEYPGGVLVGFDESAWRAALL